ncbi:MAG: hypothetical protein IPI49_18610 [Myxococcales bacterium]|nr:hypothetical protein [Myxococcales bacterium]
MTMMRIGMPAGGSMSTAAPGAFSGDVDDDALLTRLRDLALVDLEALTSGLGDDAAAAMVAAHADDLADALAAARRRIAELRAPVAATDPLALLDLPAHVKRRGDGRDAAARATEQLGARAAAARQLARFDDMVAPLLPRYFAAERRRGS